MINRENALHLLERMCAQPSISATGEGIRQMAELLQEMFEENGITTKVFETGGSPIVLGEVTGKGETTLILYNHYDVQPPDPIEEWDSPPFKPTKRDGKIYVRGVADNKGNIAARIMAVNSILQSRDTLPVNIKFIIEGEEEIGSPHFENFVDTHSDIVKGDGCIWETGYKNENERLALYLGMKGIYYVELVAKGPKHDLHSSLGTIVPNPAWKLVKALDTLKDEKDRILINGFYENVREPTSQELKALDAIPFDEETKKQRLGIPHFINELTGQQLKRKHLFEPACNICGLKAGWIQEGSKTVLPAKAIAKIGFRLVPDQNPKLIEQKLRAHLSKHGFEEIELKPAEGTKPARTPLDDPFARIVKDAAEKVYEKDPIIYPTAAGSGPIHTIRKLDIPVIGAGVGYYDSKTHAPNENIKISDYIQGIKHIKQIIQDAPTLTE